jgi:hypothetical protein
MLLVEESSEYQSSIDRKGLLMQYGIELGATGVCDARTLAE